MSSTSASAGAEAILRTGLVTALLCLAGCQPRDTSIERLIPVFGTIVRVEVMADPATAEAALDRIETLYRRIDVDWRSFGPGELGRANEALASGQAVELSAELAGIVARSLEMRDLSEGLFDPRIGMLIRLWGFDDLAHATPARPPAEAAIEAGRRALAAAELHLDGRQLRADAPVVLELAGVAKGSALAAGAVILRAAGIRNAVIVAGGDVLALGRRGTRPWRIGVRDPLGSGVLGRIELADGEAIASSGVYERYFRDGGGRYHHLLDPRTGRPAAGAAGTTVIDPDPELANAAAATLLIGGPASFEELVHRLGIDCALLVTTAGERLMTACMRQRLQNLADSPILAPEL